MSFSSLLSSSLSIRGTRLGHRAYRTKRKEPRMVVGHRRPYSLVAPLPPNTPPFPMLKHQSQRHTHNAPVP
jgi:hypothetical protein